MQPVSKQRILNNPTTIGVLLEAVFSILFLKNGYKEELVDNQ
jgi:hypothetical protein